MPPAFELVMPPLEGDGGDDDQIGFKSRVTVIGSGSWGSVAAKLVASNTLQISSFHDDLKMWVFEETLQSGEKLTDAINRTNENVKYLPGIKLGKNVIADPDLDNAVKDANMLVFVTPHQFIDDVCKSLVDKVRSDVEAISLIKGMEVKIEGPCLLSSCIPEQLGINCSVLMGANLANEIAEEKFSEATVGYRDNREIAEQWVQLFSTPYFMVTPVQDVEGVKLCGTLKNIVAIAAGFVDGLDIGSNTKVHTLKKCFVSTNKQVQDVEGVELCGTLKNAGIPKKIVKEYGNELSSSVLLTVPSGDTWHVELTKSDSAVWLQNGWQEFFEFYSLEIGHLLDFIFQESKTQKIHHPFSNQTEPSDFVSSTCHVSPLGTVNDTELNNSFPYSFTIFLGIPY
ncbi:hypothetical protein GQ457_05G018850 [Hibiscus cannabinus]